MDRKINEIQTIQPKGLGYVLGVLVGDGSLNKHKSHFSVLLGTTDKNFANQFSFFLKKLTDSKIQRFYSRTSKKYKGKIIHSNVVVVKAYSKNLYNYLYNFKNDTNYLQSFLETQNNEMKLYFLIGFFDSEGSVSNYKKGYFAVSLTNSNLKLLKICENIFNIFNIQISGIYSDRQYYKLMIYKKREIKRFQKLIHDKSSKFQKWEIANKIE